MEEPKSVIHREFDRSGRYEGGLKSLVKSLQWAFFVLLVVIIGMLVYFLSWGGYFSVEPQQAVVVLRFGKFQQVHTTGGWWYLPYPVNRFVRIQTNQQFLNVDFLPQPLPGGELQNALEPGRDTYLMTGDANIIHTAWQLAYQVVNPTRYYEALATPAKPVDNGRVVADEIVTDYNGFTGTRGPQTMLRNLFRQAVIQVTSVQKVDDILAAGKNQYQNAVAQKFTNLVAEADCGIRVESVSLVRAFPPQNTKAAFDEVTAAGNASSAARNKAVAFRIETENDTLAKRAEILANAETYERQVVSEVKSESLYFQSILKEYQLNPRTVLMALYTAALSDAMQASSEDKFIMGSLNARRQLWLQLNPEPKNNQQNAAKTEVK